MVFFAMWLEITYAHTCVVDDVCPYLCRRYAVCDSIVTGKKITQIMLIIQEECLGQKLQDIAMCCICTAFLISVIAYYISDAFRRKHNNCLYVSVAFLSTKTNALTNVRKLLLFSIFLTNNLYIVKENT